MKIGNGTLCDGCGCEINLETDIAIHSEALTFCESNCLLDYMHTRLPRHMHERFQAQARPENWRKLGSSLDF